MSEKIEKQGFEGWLAKVRFALAGTRHFTDDLTLHKEAWKSMYYNDQIQPHKAVEMDMPGVIVPYYFRKLHFFTESETKQPTV